VSNVTECIDLFLYNEIVTPAQFRAIMVEAAEKDAVINEARVSYWRQLQALRKEREAVSHGDDL
jgi:hypothetical protein